MKLSDNEIVKFIEHAMYSAKGEDGFKEIHWEHFKDILDLINRLKAEKEKCESQMKLLEAFLNDYKLAYEKAKVEIERFKDIESTISEFWTGLEKLSIFKGKDKPTLEELLEYIEQKDEEIERLNRELTTSEMAHSELLMIYDSRCAQLRRYQEREYKLMKELAELIKVEFYKEFDELIPSIMSDKIDNLLAELTPTLNELPHNSLCETETHER